MRRRILRCVVASLVALSVCLHAQDEVKSPPQRFEVVSVRMIPPDSVTHDAVSTTLSPPGANPFLATSASLKILIQLAYEIDAHRVVGLPDWVDATEYNITARAEGGKGLNYKELQLPMQHLLAERFHLAFHRETREMEGFALVVAKGGPKFAESKGGAATPIMTGRELRMQNMSMSVFAVLLGRPVDRPVADKTGLRGQYDLDLKFAPLNAVNPDQSNVFEALQEQLGLKLERAKVPVEVLVIDHVDRTPTED